MIKLEVLLQFVPVHVRYNAGYKVKISERLNSSLIPRELLQTKFSWKAMMRHKFSFNFSLSRNSILLLFWGFVPFAIIFILHNIFSTHSISKVQLIPFGAKKSLVSENFMKKKENKIPFPYFPTCSHFYCS